MTAADTPPEADEGTGDGTGDVVTSDASNPEGGRPNRRKTRTGVVVSAKPDKTVVVEVVDFVRHRRYEKTLRRTRKLHVHDEANDVGAGDTVRIQETRPMSKLKRWRVVEVLERAR